MSPYDKWYDYAARLSYHSRARHKSVWCMQRKERCEMKKIAYRCPECGSKNVIAEGPLRWVEDQGYPYDEMTCLDCDHTSDYSKDFEVELGG